MEYWRAEEAMFDSGIVELRKKMEYEPQMESKAQLNLQELLIRVGLHTVKNPPAMQPTQVQSLGRKDSLEKGMATREYSCLENPTDRGAWQATVHGVEESQPERLTLSNSIPSMLYKRILDQLIPWWPKTAMGAWMDGWMDGWMDRLRRGWRQLQPSECILMEERRRTGRSHQNR